MKAQGIKPMGMPVDMERLARIANMWRREDMLMLRHCMHVTTHKPIEQYPQTTATVLIAIYQEVNGIELEQDQIKK